MLGRDLWLKTIALLVFCLWLEIFEKLKTIDLMITSRNVTFFRSACSTEDLLTVGYNKVVRVCNRSGAT